MPLRSELVDSYWHSCVADEPVDTVGLPLEDSFFTNSVPVAVEHEPGASDARLKSPGRHHGRSYEVVADTPALWQDRYGNQFSTLISKGNNFSRPDVIKSLTAPSGYIPYGLQEGDAILRVLRASRLMREARVDTEWIVRVTEPKVLYFEGEPLDPAEYKKELYFKLIGRKSINGDGTLDAEPNRYSDKELGTISKELNRMDFFITLRGLSINERILDVLTGWTALNLVVIEKVFDTYNRLAEARAEDIEALGLPKKLWLGTKPLSEFADLEEVFDPNEVMIRNSNIDSYFTFVLPSLVGMNMARMHNKDLVHRFPTLTNLTSLGGIVDLDSVRGTPLDLGDDPITNIDMAEDIDYMFEEDQDKELLVLFTAVLNHVYAFTKADKNQNKCAHSFKNYLLKSYLQFREWDSENDGIVHKLDFLHELAIVEKWDNYSLHYAAKLTEEYVGDLCKTRAREYLEANPVQLNEKEVAYAMFTMFIQAYAENSEIIDLTKDESTPSEEEVKEAIKQWLFVDDPEEGILIRNEFAPHLMGYIHAVVLEGMQKHFAEFIQEVTEEAKGTPIENLDSSMMNFVFISNIHRLVHDYVLQLEMPGQNKVFELIVSRFMERLPEIRQTALHNKKRKI